MPPRNHLSGIRFHALSDKGLCRSRNEDAHAVYGPGVAGRQACLFAVGDGIGGHTCGDIASRMACTALKAFFSTMRSEAGGKALARRLGYFFRTLDDRIRQAGIRNAACEDMGTTLSALAITDRFGALAHAGDSRIYRFRQKRLRQLTTDHTFVQDMIEEGELSAEKAAQHPLRHMLTRAVGTQEPLDGAETAVVDLLPGDRFLLSSDGLHGLVTADEIASILATVDDPRPAAESLVKAALDKGGHDNVTVIAVYL